MSQVRPEFSVYPITEATVETVESGGGACMRSTEYAAGKYLNQIRYCGVRGSQCNKQVRV